MFVVLGLALGFGFADWIFPVLGLGCHRLELGLDLEGLVLVNITDKVRNTIIWFGSEILKPSETVVSARDKGSQISSAG